MEVNNIDNYEQRLSHIPDHLKCGEVYTWQCAGHLYAVQCILCEDRPLCPLSEFPQHMEVWHTDWEDKQNLSDNDKLQGEHSDDEHDDLYYKDVNEYHSLSFTTEESGLYDEQDDEEVSSQFNNKEILEPFEQVLIEQDNNTTIPTSQINEDIVDYCNDDAGYDDVNSGGDSDSDEKAAPVAELLGEIVCKQIQQRKQKNINKTITKYYKNKQTQRDQQYEMHDSKREFRGNNQQSKQYEIQENMREFSDMETTRDIERDVLATGENIKTILRAKSPTQHKQDKNKKENNTILKYAERPIREIQIINYQKDNLSHYAITSGKNITDLLIINTIKRNLKERENLMNNIEDIKRKTNNRKSIEKHENYKSMKTIKRLSGIVRKPKCLEMKRDPNNSRDERTETEKNSIELVTPNEINDTRKYSLQNLKDFSNYLHINNKESTRNLKIYKRDESSYEGYGDYESDTIEINERLTKSTENNEITQSSDQNTWDFESEISENETNYRKRTSKKQHFFTYQNLLQNLKEHDKTTGEENSAYKIRDNRETNYNENLPKTLSRNKNRQSNFIKRRQIKIKNKGKQKVESDAESECKTQTYNRIKQRRAKANLRVNKIESAKVKLSKGNPKVKLREHKKDTEEQEEKIVTEGEESILIESTPNNEEYSNITIERQSPKISANIKERLGKTRSSDKKLRQQSIVNGSETEKLMKKQLELNAIDTRASLRYPRGVKQRNDFTSSPKGKNDFECYDSNEILETNIAIETSNASWGKTKCTPPFEVNKEKINTEESKTNAFAHLKFINGLPDNIHRYNYCKTRKIFMNNKPNIKNCISEIDNIKLRNTNRETNENLNEKSKNEIEDLEMSQKSENFLIENTQNVYDPSSTGNFLPKESSTKQIKQTLVTQYFTNKTVINETEEEHSELTGPTNDPQFEQYCLDSNSYSNVSTSTPSPQQLYSQDSATPMQSIEPLSPISPKTEEEHFEFYEPREKLTKHHISYLIKLYQDHPRLWDQSHTDFCEPNLCRKSWQEITDQWNEYCKRNFTIAEVRIRICTLCQRYLQERERLALEGELDEFVKFPYYEEMQFLEQQKSLQKRKELYEQQNEKILEIYKHFSILWHVSYYKLKQAKERANAFQSISKALKLCGIHLSSMEVQKRIRSLRKCYRLEKIRYLHALVEQTPFESSFKHFQRMQFLNKHIDPFVCRICDKIFENLSIFREHLEEENHGSILDKDSDSESDKEKDEFEKSENSNNFSDIKESQQHNNNIKEFTSEIKETFSPEKLVTSNKLTQASLENHVPIIQEVLIFPPNASEGSILTNFNIEDKIIEEMIENITNDESCGPQSLYSFFSSANSCEEITSNNSLTQDSIPFNFINPENSNTEELKNQIESLESSITEELKAKVQDLKRIGKDQGNKKIFSNPEGKDSSNPLVVKVQSADFSLDLELNPAQEPINSSDNELFSSVNINNTPLSDNEIRTMIGLYRKYPQLWNPNHLDYNFRNLRRQAWFTLTTEFSSAVGKKFSWRTLHRKLTDYAKYYKKLITEQQNYEDVEIKWTFYEDFKFLDDVIAVHDELQRSVHHRENNFKIIAIYETLPQLWDIKHPNYNKRYTKQRNIELMCNRLQEENNLQITTERLKNRLIELRTQYRAAKKKRLKCAKNQQKFFTDFEFYEALRFLDPHIDPFICELCKLEFKKLTDYNYHQRRQHGTNKVLKNTSLSLLSHELDQDGTLENVCHICGIKFTTRSNLVNHVKRHEGIKNYACTMCPKKFYASHSLKIHIRSHTKECPYTCEKCGMSFVSASKLNQHVKRHSNKRDFVCNYCSKDFYTAFERDRHERRHLNIRDKICPICGKTFVAGSSYYAHMMLHNETKRFKCDKCEMKFAQYAGLYKHKKRHHSKINEA